MAGIESALGEVFFQKMKNHENRIAQFIDDTNETQTYDDILQKSVRVALILRDKNGIKPGDVIGLCSKPNKDVLLPFIAGQYLLAINANFCLNFTHASLEKLIQNLQPKVIFIDEEFTELIEDSLLKSAVNANIVIFRKSVKHTEFDEYLKPHPEENIFQPLKINNNKETAMILFSSGTTGEPKGICLSHYTFLKHGISNDLFVSSKKEEMLEIYLSKGGLNWIGEICILTKSIINGSARIIWIQMDAKNVWRIIEKYRVTYAFLSPYLASEIARSRPEKIDTSNLRVFQTGGYIFPTKSMELLKKALPTTFLTQCLGQTEVGGFIALFKSTNEENIKLQEKKPRSCGIIWDQFQWKVVDVETDQPLGPNQPGELRLKSDFIMNGYFKMDSSSTFDSEGYFKTGDVVYYDSNNCLYVTDRIKEMFKYRSYQIAPAVLEEILMQHPSVKEALVIGIPHEEDSNHAMGLVVLKNENDEVKGEDIEKFVEERVYEVQRLRAGVRIVKELQKNFAGKYQKKIIKNNILMEIGIKEESM